MKRVRYVIAGLAVLSVTTTVYAARTGGLERTIAAVGRTMSRFAVSTDHAANAGRARAGQSDSDYRWSGSLAAGDLLEIKGINGDITVGLAPGGDVVVTAEAHGRRSDPALVRIERVEHAGGLTFCAVYPSREGERANECAPGEGGRMSTSNNDVSVDFEVLLPAGVDFVGRTINGEIEAIGLESDVLAVTVNGDVEVSTTGFAEAQTVNGSIEASMGALEIVSGASFTTVNGSIDLDLADEVDADVEASWLNGDFESDLPFMLQGRVQRRSAHGTLGDGGPMLELETVNGSIHIR